MQQLAGMSGQRYDGPVANIFAVQDQFIRKIAKALAVELTVEEQEEIALGQTANLSAREVFQKGWENYLSYSAKDNAMAVNQFKSALDLDPEYGRAYAALGLAYLRGCQLRWNKPLGVSIGVANAMALNYLGEAKTRPSTLANVAASRIYLYNNRYDVAQSEAVLAIAKDPNDPEGYVALAWAMITTGQPEAGLELMERATRCCQRNFNQSQSSQQAHFYATQSWRHSVKAALRVCLKTCRGFRCLW